jgi:hypothetical protein
MAQRDDFAAVTKRILADRVGHRCSNPACRASTCGPQADPNRSVNVGVAAHISAASRGGARYNAEMSTDERTSVANGIWLCQTCGKLVDNDVVTYDPSTLRKWKAAAESLAFGFVGKAVAETLNSTASLSVEASEILLACADEGEIHLLDSAQAGPWVAIGARHFLDQNDPAVAATFRDALEELVAKGLVRHDAGILYALTGKGFRVARRLREFMAGKQE